MTVAVPRIADYALLGDCHSSALVGRDGSIDWWCSPRFDSRSAFARLLDPAAGHWSIRPVEPYEVEREYVPGTMAVRTTFRTAGGAARLTDALALAPGARGHTIGLESPHALVRVVEVVRGRVRVAVEFAPRLEYGMVTPVLEAADGALRTFGGPDRLVLHGDHSLEVDGGSARGELVLGEGETAAFALHHLPGLSGPGETPLDARRTLEDTIAGWRSWAALHPYEGAYQDQVRRSAMVLQALTYGPSGAVVAAPTTSLPEIAGGELNWDYRYAWLRDAALTLRALWVAACPDEAARFFGFMARAAAGSGRAHVQIVFGLEGERDLTEHELPHLRGYRDSRPVHVGNGAWDQKQLDVYGEVMDAAWMLRDQLGDQLDPQIAGFLRGLCDQAARTWEETDAGIWEGREGERHYTSSKLMCWVALDRGVKLAPRIGAEAHAERWAGERDRVRAAILEQGWSEEAGAYTGAFGSDRLDASVLLMPLMGFLPATDERMRATVEAVERTLGSDGLVLRWTDAEDGAFVICSYWLADCLARAGEVDRARAVFDGVSAHASDLGLLSEEVDPRDGQAIGNFPQTFAHAGLINAAWSIDQAGRDDIDEGDG